jgi:hypothetical protein
MWSLGLWKTKTIKEFWAIGCESGMEYRGLGRNDMAEVVGVYAYRDTGGNYAHIYIGNTRVIWAAKLLDTYIGYPSAIAKIIQKHSTVNLDTTLTDCQWTELELRALWGDDYKKGSDKDKDGFVDNTLWWWPWEIELWRVMPIQ